MVGRRWPCKVVRNSWAHSQFWVHGSDPMSIHRLWGLNLNRPPYKPQTVTGWVEHRWDRVALSECILQRLWKLSGLEPQLTEGWLELGCGTHLGHLLTIIKQKYQHFPEWSEETQSLKTIFKMSRITWHMKREENLNSHGKSQWTDTNAKRTQVLDYPAKSLKQTLKNIPTSEDKHSWNGRMSELQARSIEIIESE